MAKWFTDEEIRHLHPALIRALDEARTLAGVPFVITSGFREGDPLAHGRHHAVDIACATSVNRYLIVRAAFQVGFRRIGVYDKHIHLDIDTELPQDVLWWGKSK